MMLEIIKSLILHAQAIRNDCIWIIFNLRGDASLLFYNTIRRIILFSAFCLFFLWIAVLQFRHLLLVRFRNFIL